MAVPSGARLFHYAVLVVDLEPAVARFTRDLGIRFTPVRSLEVRQGDGTLERRRLAYSQDGPMHCELIEASGRSGLHAVASGDAFHHVGAWVEDIARVEAELSARGVEIEGRSLDEDGSTTVIYAAPASFNGVRHEFLAASLRPRWEAFLRA